MSALPSLALAPSAKEVRLDLGGGQHVREGFDCVDLNAPNPAHRVDLFKFPWPFEDNSVDELHASHLIEHIPAHDITYADLSPRLQPKDLGPGSETENYKKFNGQDMLLAFFDECYRILKPGGFMTLIWPALKTVRAFQDPTHRRFIPAETMYYLSAEWRKMNGLDHYRVNCNFAFDTTFSMPQEISARHPEVQAQKFRESWDVIIDYHAKLKSLKPEAGK